MPLGERKRLAIQRVQLEIGGGIRVTHKVDYIAFALRMQRESREKYQSDQRKHCQQL